MLRFDDAVAALNLSADQEGGVYYFDGRFANGTAVSKRLGIPLDKLLGITTQGATGKGITILDFEAGNVPYPSIPAVVAWIDRQLKLGVYRPCVYASESVWKNGLRAALAKYGAKIRRWMAWYGQKPVVPPGFDALQYADPGPVDNDVALDNFFATSGSPVVRKPQRKPVEPVVPPPLPKAIEAWLKSVTIKLYGHAPKPVSDAYRGTKAWIERHFG